MELSSATIVDKLDQKHKLSTVLRLLPGGFLKLIIVFPVVFFQEYVEFTAIMINTAIEIAAPTSHARVTGEVQYHARHRASPISII